MNKSDIIHEVARRGNFTIGDATIFLNVLIEIFEDAVYEKIPIDIRGWFSRKNVMVY